MDTYLIADEITVKFFSLIGVEGEVIEHANQCLERIKELVEKEEVIILVGESLAAKIEEQLEEIKKKHYSAIITEVPDSTETKLGRENIDTLIKEAIGIKF